MTAPFSPRESAGYIPWQLLALAAFLFLMAAVVLVSLLVLTRPADLPGPTVTAVVVTVPPANVIATPTLQAAPMPVPSLIPTDAPPPPPAGDVKVGAYVQVTGTGSEGFLNLRAEPGIASPVNYLAIEREVLQVQAGPRDGDGFVWWYLVDPATNTKYGWAVQNYLQVVPGP